MFFAAIIFIRSFRLLIFVKFKNFENPVDDVHALFLLVLLWRINKISKLLTCVDFVQVS